MYDGFAFRGRSVAEFGAEAYWGESFAVGGKVRRASYALPEGGSVLIGPDVWEERTHSLTLLPSGGATDEPSWRRRILQWLQGARGELIWDSDPGMIRLARFDAPGSGGGKVSPIGGMTLSATLDGLVRSAQERAVTGDTATRKIRLAMPSETGIAAPLRIVIQSKGSLTGVNLKVAGASVVAKGITLPSGKVAEYYAGDPHGTPARFVVDGAPNYAGFASGQWGILRAGMGEEILIETLGAEARVTVSARGWYVD